MRAYKAFDYDWTCNGFQYKVGEEYTFDGEISICKSGFHACKELKDCFKYYSCVGWNKFAEVEILGEVLTYDKDSKVVTNRIKIIKEIPFEDLKNFIGNAC